MLWEGLKLMVVGMATVMIFLILLIACIELVKYLTRNHAALVLENQKNQQKSVNTSIKLENSKIVPVEVFAAAISAFEVDIKKS